MGRQDHRAGRAAIGERFDATLAARVCRRFFLDDRTKQEIAAELGISRFKVARLLGEARTRGLVRIEVLDPGELDTHRNQALRARWGLREALVVTPDDPEELLPALGAGAARLLRRLLRPGDVLGIAWGSTLHATVSALEAEGGPRPVDVVQLAGGLQGVEPAYNAIELARRAARALGGRLYPLYAPALLESAATCARLLHEPSVASSVRMFDQVTVAMVGIGALQPQPTSALYLGGVLSQATLEALHRLGAVGDAFCHFLDADGNVLTEFSDRIIGMKVEQITAVPLRIGVAGGSGKLRAIRAALHGGLVNAMVTDVATAEALLWPER
jgi:DNA-binding transcriptional regulator LsrR (DeoR family)